MLSPMETEDWSLQDIYYSLLEVSCHLKKLLGGSMNTR